MKTSLYRNEDAEKESKKPSLRLLSLPGWLRLRRIETPKPIGPGNIVANRPDEIRKHQPGRNGIHKYERNLEDGERNQKDQDAKESCKGVVPAEQDDIPQLVVEHDDDQGRERDDASGLLWHDSEQPIGDDNVNDVAEETHTDKAPQWELEAWLV